MIRKLLSASAILICLGIANTANARTWHVAADGSGDAPTIAAAVDSSKSGDVILVGPGTHVVVDETGGGVSMKAGTSLISDDGPMATFLEPADPSAQPGLISARAGCVVSGFSMRINSSSTIFVADDGVEISDNIIDGGGSLAPISVYGMANIHNNVCFGGNYGIWLVAHFDGSEIYNNIILDGVYNDSGCTQYAYVRCNLINDPQPACVFPFDNFSGDPMFCGTGNYYLQSDSPCAPGNQPGGADCGLIGPLPVGCGAVSVETKTWGGVKAIYR
jgi:hypothetical protein